MVGEIFIFLAVVFFGVFIVFAILFPNFTRAVVILTVLFVMLSWFFAATGNI